MAKCVFDALQKVQSQDELLLKLNASERAVAHRLAVYLEEMFLGYSVDCEYNLQDMGDIKNLSYTKNGIYTDIIVHHRGNNDDNLLHIEMKKTSNRAGLQGDKKRLQHED